MIHHQGLDTLYIDKLYVDMSPQMRSTKAVSVWPVGLVGKLRYESPIIKNGKVRQLQYLSMCQWLQNTCTVTMFVWV